VGTTVLGDRRQRDDDHASRHERLGIDGHGVVARAHDGDPAARAILDEVGTRLGQGFAGSRTSSTRRS
jgi:predicted NBD/HSP70 family sugar kinase